MKLLYYFKPKWLSTKRIVKYKGYFYPLRRDGYMWVAYDKDYKDRWYPFDYGSNWKGKAVRFKVLEEGKKYLNDEDVKEVWRG